MQGNPELLFFGLVRRKINETPNNTLHDFLEVCLETGVITDFNSIAFPDRQIVINPCKTDLEQYSKSLKETHE